MTPNATLWVPEVSQRLTGSDQLQREREETLGQECRCWLMPTSAEGAVRAAGVVTATGWTCRYPRDVNLLTGSHCEAQRDDETDRATYTVRSVRRGLNHNTATLDRAS